MQSGWMYLFNALINNAFRRGIYDEEEKSKICIGNAYF
jgi:hypothetical protein